MVFLMGKLKSLKSKGSVADKEAQSKFFGFLGSLKEKLKWFDPFTYVDVFLLPRINPNGDKRIEFVVYLLSAFVFAFVIYNYVLAFLLGSPSPIVIVYSGSMEPFLYRGDLVFLRGFSGTNVSEISVDFPVSDVPLRSFARPVFDSSGKKRVIGVEVKGDFYPVDSSGPVVVYRSDNFGEDIIHRAVLKVVAPDGVFFLTLGDNNLFLDQDCPLNSLLSRNCISPYLVKSSSIKGVYFFHVPFLGHLKLVVFDGFFSLVRLFF